MPPGKSAFTPPQRERLDRAITAAQDETGLTFAVAVGPQPETAVDLAREARSLAASLPEPGGVIILLDPGARRLEIGTSGAGRRRIPDRQVGLAALSITSRISVGDVVGALVDGVRILAETAGRGSGSAPAVEVGHSSTPAHVQAALPHGHHLEHGDPATSPAASV